MFPTVCEGIIRSILEGNGSVVQFTAEEGRPDHADAPTAFVDVLRETLDPATPFCTPQRPTPGMTARAWREMCHDEADVTTVANVTRMRLVPVRMACDR